MRKSMLAVSLAMLMALGVSAAAMAPSTAPAGEAPAAVETPDDPGSPADKTAETGPADKDGKTATTQPGGWRGLLGNNTYLYIMVGGFLLLWIWMGRGRKKEKKKRQNMLDAIKKGDKVTSIGGIIGTVVDLRDEDVTVKIDETGNVRMKFARWAIRDIGDSGKAEKKD